MKNRFVVLLAGLLLAGSLVFGAAIDGTWTLTGVQTGTGPGTLVLQSNGQSLSGTVDGVAITNGKVEGTAVHFNLVQGGTPLTYKGTISGSQLNLHESHSDGSQHRAFNFNRSN